MARSSFNALATAVWLALGVIADGATLATWNGATANWTQAAEWNPNSIFPNNDGPITYDAQIGAGAVSLDQAITINRLLLGGGAVEGAATLTALEGMAWTGGSLRGAGVLTLGSAVPTTITGSATPLILHQRTVNHAGSATFTAGTITGGGGAVLNNQTGATFTVLAGANFFADAANPTYTLNNAGTFTARSTSGVGFTTVDAAFNNTGTLRVENTGAGHTLSLAGGGTHSGAVDLAADTLLELGGATTLQTGTAFTGPGLAVVAGDVLVSGSISAVNLAVAVGELNVGNQTVNVSGFATQTGGTIRLAGGLFRVGSGAGLLAIDDGTLTGTGTIDAALESFGVIAPGAALGDLAVTGAVDLGSDARLEIELGGASLGQFDRLLIGGSAALDGTLEVRLANGFAPAPGDTFTILTSSALSGFFANAPSDGSRFTLADGNGSFEIDYTATSVVLLAYVPEPTTAVLSLAGLVVLGMRRRAVHSPRLPSSMAHSSTAHFEKA